MSEIRYPDCVVELSGRDGNIFMIMGRVRVALRRHLRGDGEMSPRAAEKYVDAFTVDVAGTKSYDEALAVVMSWVMVE